MKPQYFLMIVLTIISFFLVQLFFPFMKPIVVAFLLAIATNNINRFAHTKIQNQLGVSVTMTLALGALFFAPIIYFMFVTVDFIGTLTQAQIFASIEKIRFSILNLSQQFPFVKQFLNESYLVSDSKILFDSIVGYSQEFAKMSMRFLFDMVLILVFYFLFNLYGHEISNFIKEILPFRKQDTNELLFETANVMSVVFYSILVTAIFEGFLFGGFIYFYGYDALLFGILYGFASLIPVVGGALMWVPLSAYEYLNGDTGDALVIALYTIIVISVVADTFIKPIIIKYINVKVVQTPTNVNELFLFFAIVAGLSTFGFWGMIIGPALATFFISVLKSLKQFME